MPLSSSGVSLAVPPSQNTAEVHEFRCLFTHDVRRKAKRWHDGYLTFHTFNNRAIVFDDSRHKVGDTYTKAGDRVNEGDDLTLQQGVLVEVGEPLGTREQDVSQVIVARDSPRAAGNNAGRPSVQSRPQGQRPGLFRPANGALPAAGPNVALGAGNAPALAGQRPKSLKEVLSTPSGSMGRARISARSPYERRHDNLSGRHEMKAPLQICRIVEPAAPLENDMGPRKRQGLNGDGGNGADGTDITSQAKKRQRQGIGSGDAVATSPSSRSQVSIQDPGTRAVNPILLESDEEIMRQSPLTVTPIHISAGLRVPTDKQEAGRTADESTVQNTKQKKSKPKPKSKSALKPREDMEIATEPVKKAKSKLKIAKEKKSNEGKPSQNENSSSRSLKSSRSEDFDTQSESQPLQERSINLLRMSTTGRRRKLMYSDILPNRHVSKKSKLSQDFNEEDGGENTLEASSTASKRKPSTPIDKIAKKRKRKPLLIQDIEDGELEDTLSSNAAKRHTPSRVAQEDSGSAISHGGSDIHEDMLITDMSIMDVADEFSVNEEHQEGVEEPQPESLADRDKAIVSAQRQTQVVTSDARSPSSHSIAENDIPTLPPGNASSQHSTSIKQSENEYVAPEKVEPTDQQQIANEGRQSFEAVPRQSHHSHRSPLKRVVSAPITKSPRQVRLLTKSISDMSSIAAGADAGIDAAAAEDDDDAFLDLHESTDLGPWSREAFDLFGWKEGDKKGVDDGSEERKDSSAD